MIETINRPEMTETQLMDWVLHRRGGRFISLSMRNRVAKRLKASGCKIRVESSRHQRLHPMYLADFVGQYEVGFGNTDYLTEWKSVYAISILEYPKD